MQRTLVSLLGLPLALVCGCGSPSDADGTVYATDCAALQSLFVTDAVESVDDWSGYWLCFEEENNCSGTECTWSIDDLDDYVLSETCGDAGSCTIDGETIQECESVANTGFVTVDCGTDGEISITANGLPDHTFENYALSGQLPPLLGSAESNAVYTMTTAPVYNSEIDVFATGGGTVAVAINGVSLYNQFTGTGAVAVTDEIVDDCGGHPANETYHYHAYPECGALAAEDRLGFEGIHSGLVGLSRDGFPILGPYGFNDPSDANSDVVRLESCYALTECTDETDASCYAFDDAAHSAGTCHLDACNGRIAAVPPALQAALGAETYAYHMTLDDAGLPAFPYQPYCYRGDYAVTGGGTGPGAGAGSGPPQQPPGS